MKHSDNFMVRVINYLFPNWCFDDTLKLGMFIIEVSIAVLIFAYAYKGMGL